jgi:SAM-dependent methyltransferase
MRVLDDNLAPSTDRRRRVLDVGCGTGTMVTHLARYGRVYGVDMDHEAVGYCYERDLHTVVQAAAGHLPFPDATFDLVTMLDVLEHIEDERNTLDEVSRVLRPGGVLTVAVPAYRFLWGAQDDVSQHRRRYSAKQLADRMLSAGLRVKRLTYFNTTLFPPIAAIRLFRRAVPQARSTESDFTFPTPGPMNRLLATVFGLESAVVARTDLPFGVSILCLAEKEPAPT